jgi:hypothetical protein
MNGQMMMRGGLFDERREDCQESGGRDLSVPF